MARIFLPESRENLGGSEIKEWQIIENADNYIKGIISPDTDDAQAVMSYLTAIPTPWARAELFKYAIIEGKNKIDEGANTVAKVLSYLRSELTGVLCSIAAVPEAFRTARTSITLKEMDNLFALENTLGFHLSEQDWALWRALTKSESDHEEGQLAIDLLFCRDELIGAFHPHCVLFTNADYQVDAGDLFVKDGKFFDPIQHQLNIPRDTLNAIYSYFIHIRKGYNHFISSLESSYATKVTGKIDEFLHGLANSITNSYRENLDGENCPDISVVASDSQLARIFNYSLEFAINEQDQIIKIDPHQNFTSDFLRFSSSEIFADSLTTDVLHFADLKMKEAEHSLSDYLDTKVGDKTEFFSWPLTEKGLIIIKDQRQKGKDASIQVYDVRYDGNLQEITIVIHLTIQELSYPLSISRSYKVVKAPNKQIVVWPDFVSEHWDSYYMYSEYPDNQNVNIKAVPFFAQMKGRQFRLVKKSVEETIYHDQLRYHLEHSIVKTNDKSVNYEISHSKYPFAGIKFSQIKNGEQKNLGFLLLKESNNNNNIGLKVINEYNKENSYDIGVDFGSNNTSICIHYDGLNKIIDIKNRRGFIVGKEVQNNDEHPALQHEMMFFPNENTPGNKIKSMIVKQDMENENLEDHVLGLGIPVFEKNIHVTDIDSHASKLTVQLSNSDYLLFYNQKWSEGTMKIKLAYMKTLLEMIRAEVYSDLKITGIKSLGWAFPKLDEKLKGTYFNEIWSKFDREEDDPRGYFGKVASISESESIYHYMRSTDGNALVQNDSVAVGLDVGGSTTDVVYLGVEGEKKLLRQSSIKIAAGSLAQQSIFEKDFLQSVKQIAKQAELPLYNIDKVKNTELNSFYFNQLVDNLGQNGLNKFYKHLYVTSPRMIVLNAYLTGFTMFYAGVNIGYLAIRSGIKYENIDIKIYGKGGQMFDWLPKILDEGTNLEYFKKCVAFGIQAILTKERNDLLPNKVKIMYPFEREEDHELKTEVSKGICSYLNQNHSESETSSTVGELTKDKTGTTVQEENFLFESLNGSPLGSGTLDFLQDFGIKTTVPNKPEGFPIFNTFIELFCSFVSKNSILSNHVEVGKLKDFAETWNLVSYIHNHDVYKRAIKETSKDRSISVSLLAFEGMCYLEQLLNKELAKN